MLDFPSTPSLGQEYPLAPVAGVPTYVWDGEKWTSQAHARAIDLTGFLPLIGGTMTGPIVLAADPAAPLHPATKQYADAMLPLKGGALTGPLTGTAMTMTGAVKGGTVSGGRLDVDSTVATYRQVRGLTSGSMRWSISMPDATAESGANAGSNFAIDSYSDAGSNIATVLTINRASGNANFTGGAQFVNYINIKASATGQAELIQFYNAGGSRAGWIGQYPANANSMVFACDLSGGNLTINADASLSTPTSAAYKSGGGPWLATSDARIKDVRDDYHAGLAEVLGLRPVVYSYKGNDGDPGETRLFTGTQMVTGREFIGLIAQEAEQVMPEMVTQGPGWIDGLRVEDLRSLDTGPLLFALVNAFKEMKAELDALKAA